MTMTADGRALLTLHLIPGLGPRLTAALLARFGSPTEVLQATSEQLRSIPYLGAKLADEIPRAIARVDLTPELELIASHDVRVFALGELDYPAPLAVIPDPPHLLYVRGTVVPADERSVALVGSRHCTAYGRRVAERLAGGLARAGWTVVSGLARGIDGAAHRAALDAGGRTLAVLAGGLSRVYPPEHADLATDVIRSGALISEARMDQEPIAGLFPVRNRLISGLTRGIVVVEAADRSGTLITARHAAEQGRTVFAVPGPIDSPASAGTHQLIRDGAVLVRGVEDILEELHEQPTARGTDVSVSEQAPAVPVGPPPGLDETGRRIWDALADQPRHLDELSRQLGIGVPQLSGLLLMLEMKKVVRRLPGNRYERG